MSQPKATEHHQVTSAYQLPIGSVVADARHAWIRTDPDDQFSWAATNGVRYTNRQVDTELAAGAAVLRVGELGDVDTDEANRYRERERELDQAAEGGEDIADRMAREKLERDTALVDEAAGRRRNKR